MVKWSALAAPAAAAAFTPSTREICTRPLACQSHKASSLLVNARILFTHILRECFMRWLRTCLKEPIGSVAAAAEEVVSVMSTWEGTYKAP
jgi:hypothetical protein